MYFNSRPHGGRRGQSTDYSNSIHFNSRPHGGRQLSEATRSLETVISTHALTEGDLIRKRKLMEAQKFQLTPSRRATVTIEKYDRSRSISTHALTEGDSKLFCLFRQSIISTHALTEGDFGSGCSLCSCNAFQLTPSRRATCYAGSRSSHLFISTHALTEGDETVPRCRGLSCHFNSRPHGGRPLLSLTTWIFQQFQLTPSRRATTISS